MGSPSPAVGGTLRVGLPREGDNAPINDVYLDPSTWYGIDEVLRCCLLRTPLSYNGRTTADGGIILRPDLAEALPDVSSDGLTWTFRLKEGIRYAPPYEDTVITARDIVRGIERAVRRREGAYFFAPLAGFDAFLRGDASAISGLEAPDERTLIARLAEPNADIATAMSLPYAAPLPEGAADRHDDNYGHFLVASGPYMYEGSESLEKGGGGKPLSAGRAPGSATLVRNPSWDRATDVLRGAWVDRIEFSRSASLEDDRARLSADEIDVPGYELRKGELEALDEDTRSRIAFASYPFLAYLPLNLALPPFDDVEVRRAVNLVIDKARLSEVRLPRIGTTFRVAHHAIPDSLENNLLLEYAPYATPGDAGNLEAARAAMARSSYDENGDGSCDAPACDSVPFKTFEGDTEAVELVTRNLAELGITLAPLPEDAEPYDVRTHAGSIVVAGWGADTPALGGFIAPWLLPPEQGEGEDEGTFSWSGTLIGSTPDQLADWGYDVEEVPAVTSKVRECLALTGSERFTCAAELDQLVMEQAVAVVPISVPEIGYLYGPRVASYSVDQSVVAPALDQIVLAP